MTPTALAQMIEELPPQDKVAAEEYISMLYATQHPEKLNELDIKYREYILAGIREGEAAIERGDYYDVEEGLKRLGELMRK
ncbi:MAG: hypothetical protein ACHQM6_07585 [Candidatus Kapaibacterium sp.]